MSKKEQIALLVVTAAFKLGRKPDNSLDFRPFGFLTRISIQWSRTLSARQGILSWLSSEFVTWIWSAPLRTFTVTVLCDYTIWSMYWLAYLLFKVWRHPLVHVCINRKNRRQRFPLYTLIDWQRLPKVAPDTSKNGSVDNLWGLMAMPWLYNFLPGLICFGHIYKKEETGVIFIFTHQAIKKR